MVVYNFSNRAEQIIYVLLLFGILLILGLVSFVCSKDVEGEENWVTKLFNIPKEKLNLSKKLFQLIGVMLFIVVTFGVSYHLKDYIFYKKINWFKSINEISGHIRNVESSEFMGIKTISFKLDSLSFSIIQDKCYISHRNLIDNDSVKIDYYYDLKGHKQNQIDTNIIVVKIAINNK